MKKILAKIWWTIILGSVMFGMCCADNEEYWWILFMVGGVVLGFLTRGTLKVAFPDEDYPEKTWEEIDEEAEQDKQ